MSAVLGIVLGIFKSAGMGAVIGAIGSVAQGVIDLIKRKQDNEFKLLSMDKDLEAAKLEAATQSYVSSQETERAIAKAEASMQAKSYSIDKVTYSSGDHGWFGRGLLVFVDFVRGMVRPVITIYMVGFLSWLTYQFLTLVPLEQMAVVNPALFWLLLEHVIYTVVFVASAAVLWWFGARASSIARGR